MSHKDYCEKLDEDQLQSLIDHANARIESLKAEGWVTVWVVADYCNRAWFHENQRGAAMDKMIELACAERQNPKGREDCEWSVQRVRMRPSEAARLIKDW
jgi:hypothetical protein